MKTLALVGASGLVGKTLVEQLSKSYTLIPTYRTNPVPGFIPLDVTKPDEYRAFLDLMRPDIVLHAAALTDLERCEHHPDEARMYNTKPLEALIEAKTKIVFISTDGVFDGERGNCREQDAPTPINVYGQTKWEAEQLLRDVPDALILRIAVPYSAQLSGKKFLPSTIAKLKDGQPVTGATDLIRSPTLTYDIGEAVHHLLQKDASGTYHVTGASSLSMYDAARTIARVFNYDESLVKTFLSTDIKINGVPSIVKRPKDCSMNCDKARSENISLRTFEEGLQYVRSFITLPREV